MPKDEHYRAAELHELAAHAHLAAAAHHGKEDHLTGHELSRQAFEHSARAYQFAQEALRKSARAAGEKEPNLAPVVAPTVETGAPPANAFKLPNKPIK